MKALRTAAAVIHFMISSSSFSKSMTPPLICLSLKDNALWLHVKIRMEILYNFTLEGNELQLLEDPTARMDQKEVQR